MPRTASQTAAAAAIVFALGFGRLRGRRCCGCRGTFGRIVTLALGGRRRRRRRSRGRRRTCGSSRSGFCRCNECRGPRCGPASGIENTRQNKAASTKQREHQAKPPYKPDRRIRLVRFPTIKRATKHGLTLIALIFGRTIAKPPASGYSASAWMRGIKSALYRCRTEASGDSRGVNGISGGRASPENRRTRRLRLRGLKGEMRGKRREATGSADRFAIFRRRCGQASDATEVVTAEVVGMGGR